MSDQPPRAEDLGAVIARYLREHGHSERVAQMSVLERWPEVAGAQIARVSEAESITADGTLIVAVATPAWISELSLHEPAFLERLNAGPNPARVRRIRWQLKRVGTAP